MTPTASQHLSYLFLESFDSTELKVPPQWLKFFEISLQACIQTNFNSAAELFQIINTALNTNFESNSNHLALNLNDPNNESSQLLGALLMSLLWKKKYGTSPLVLLRNDHYYFLSPDGEMIEASSSRKDPLSESQKFIVFNDEKTIQLNLKKLITHYFEEICDQYIEKKLFLSLTKAQSFMIKSNPEDHHWLSRRGLTYKEMSKYSLALTDFKKFLTSCPVNQVPQTIKSALIELEGLNAIDHTPEFQMH